MTSSSLGRLEASALEPAALAVNDRVDAAGLEPPVEALGDLAARPTVENGELEDREVAFGTGPPVEDATTVEEDPAQLAMQTPLLGRRATVGDQLGERAAVRIEVDQDRSSTAFLSGAHAMAVDRHALADPPQIAHDFSFVVAAERLRAPLEQTTVDVLHEVVDDLGRGPLVQSSQDPRHARAQQGLEPE